MQVNQSNSSPLLPSSDLLSYPPPFPSSFASSLPASPSPRLSLMPRKKRTKPVAVLPNLDLDRSDMCSGVPLNAFSPLVRASGHPPLIASVPAVPVVPDIATACNLTQRCESVPVLALSVSGNSFSGLLIAISSPHCSSSFAWLSIGFWRASIFSTFSFC